MNDLQMAATLRRAVGLLAKDGWNQGHLQKSNGSRCLVGAVHTAMGCRHPRKFWSLGLSEHKDMQAILLERLPADTITLWGWNDQYDRKLQEVVGLCTNTAHDLELRHQIKELRHVGWFKRALRRLRPALVPVDTKVPSPEQLTQLVEVGS